MRLRPIQIAVYLICGEPIPHQESGSLAERLRTGHDWLVGISGHDFGYDLQAWHDYLKESRDGGYTYGRNIVLPRIMQTALRSPEWREAAQSLTAVTRPNPAAERAHSDTLPHGVGPAGGRRPFGLKGRLT